MVINKKFAVIVIGVIIVAASVGGVFYFISQSGENQNVNEPTPPPNENDTVVIGNNTVISAKLKTPENDTNIVNVTVNSDSVVYTYSETPEKLSYKVGDYIVGTAGYGYLRKIVDIDKEGNKVIVHTENATLTDVVKEMSFNSTLSLTPNMISGKGLRSAPAGFQISLDRTLYNAHGITVKLKGNAESIITLVFSIRIENWHITYLYFALVTQTSSSIGIEATENYTLEKNYTVEKNVTLANYHLSPIVRWVGTLPIVFVPELVFKAGAEANFEGNFTTEISAQMTITEGALYENGNWNAVNQLTKELSYQEPGLKTKLDAIAYTICPRLNILIYDVAGPYAYLKPYLHFEANRSASLSSALHWNLGAGLEGDAGVVVKILDHNLADKEFHIFDLKWPLANGTLAPKPSAPQNLQATAGDGYVKLTWEPPASNGGSAITAYKIYRGTSSGGESYLTQVDGDTLEYNDTSVTNGQTYYYYVTAVNSVGESAKSNEVSATPEESIEVIWIHNVYELQNMSKDLSGNYALANDIDATITKTWNNGAGFDPIGNHNNPFSGIFDGKGHKIINLWINRSSQDYVGLFGFISMYAVIENVGLVNVSVRGNNYTGGLVGKNDGTVSNSYATGNVSGDWYVGGLVGYNDLATVSNSYSTGSVSGGSNVGGLAGLNYYGTVSNSYSTGNVSGGYDVGGLVGYNGLATVSNSYSTGNVSGYEDVGGLVGYNLGATVSNSYSTGSVSGGSNVGGLVGRNYFDSTVSNSYATGSVSGSKYVGGLVGLNYDGTVNNSYSTGSVSGDRAGGLVGDNHEGTVSNSYSTGSVSGYEDVGGLVGYNYYGTVTASFWDVDTSGIDYSDGGIGLHTAQMKNKTTFLNAGWDFTNIWDIIDGVTYPFLRWQNGENLPRDLEDSNSKIHADSDVYELPEKNHSEQLQSALFLNNYESEILRQDNNPGSSFSDIFILFFRVQKFYEILFT